MLKYLIIQLDATSISFCHYDNDDNGKYLMPLDTLAKAIRYGMKENLMIQFVYPEYDLPHEYDMLIETIDHIKIKPWRLADDQSICVAQVCQIQNLTSHDFTSRDLVLRGNIMDFYINREAFKTFLFSCKRVNLILTSLHSTSDNDADIYSLFLNEISDYIVSQVKRGKRIPELNVLTDRITLGKMNNCNAGDESITIGSNGKFYICPAFVHDNDTNISMSDTELIIPNKQLYKLDKAPICKKCDAFQCHRCVWLNKKKTLEVNTPGHIQCLIAHIERNASRALVKKIREIGPFMEEYNIPAIDYLDPFDKFSK